MMSFSARNSGSRTNNNVEKLAAQNTEMELRLHQLRSSMQQKKAQRAQPGVIWKSGKAGSISQHVVNILDQNAKWRDTNTPQDRKIKILGQKNSRAAPVPPKSRSKTNSAKNKKRFIRKELAVLPGPPSPTDPEDESSHLKGKQRATHSAIDAVNSYNNDTNTDNAHAMYSHASMINMDPVTTPSSSSSSAIEYNEKESHASFLEALNDWRSSGGSHSQTSKSSSSSSTTTAASINITEPPPSSNSSSTVTTSGGGGSLWDGPAYDERANARDFQNALQSWRTGTSEKELVAAESRAASRQSTRVSGESPVSVLSGSMQTETTNQNAGRKPLEFKFETTSKLSYIQKLMLKKVRSDPKSISRAYTPVVSPTMDDDSDDDDDDDDDLGDNGSATITYESENNSARTVVSTDLLIENVTSEDLGNSVEVETYNVEEPTEAYVVVVEEEAANEEIDAQQNRKGWVGRITVTPEYSEYGSDSHSPTPEHQPQPIIVEEPSQQRQQVTTSESVDALTPMLSDHEEDVDSSSTMMDRNALLKSMGALSKNLSTNDTTTTTTTITTDSTDVNSDDVSTTITQMTNKGMQDKRLEAITPSLMNDFEEMERSFTKE